MKIVLTGAAGFLGWHTRLRLAAQTDFEVVAVSRLNWSRLGELMADADAVIHLAGVNRADCEAEVEEGNIRLANDLARAIDSVKRPLRVVVSGTIQVTNDTGYGRGKLAAKQIIESSTLSNGGHFVDVCLPNLFGEHGLPGYNSFIATLVDAVIAGTSPAIRDNRVELLHVQEAAESIIGGLSCLESRIRPIGVESSVQEVWDLLTEFHRSYCPSGEFPDLSSDFRIDLFNTYRAGLFPAHYPIALVPHSDPRGSFVETVRCRGGEGQSSFSTTAPGVTRGEHFHLKKIERFAVVQGDARISLRRMFHSDIVHFDVTGSDPVAVDMPVGWAHNITNTGSATLLTQFWSHELFRSDAPDTYPAIVLQTGEESEA